MLGRLAVATALCLFVVLQQAHALGLGDIQVQSRLNQRFAAVVPFTSLSDDEAVSVRANIADNAAFARAGLDRSGYLSTIAVNVVADGANPRLELSSQELAREPLLTLLLEVRTAGGPRVFREYTIFLSPPVAAVAPATSAAASPPAEEGPRTTAAPDFYQTPEEVRAQPVGPAQPAASVSASPPGTTAAYPATGGPASYGPIRTGDAMWKIANAVRPAGVGTNQTMLALFQANPSAFIDGDINQIRTGVSLQVPTPESMRTVSESVAGGRIRELSQPAESPTEASSTGIVEEVPVAAEAEPAVDTTESAPAVADASSAEVAGVAEAADAAEDVVQEESAPTADTGSNAVAPGTAADPLGVTPDAGAGPTATSPPVDGGDLSQADPDPATDTPAGSGTDTVAEAETAAPAEAMYDVEEVETGEASPVAEGSGIDMAWLPRILPLLIGALVLLLLVLMVRARRERKAQLEYEAARSSMTSAMPVPRPTARKALPTADEELAALGREAQDDDATRIAFGAAVAGGGVAAATSDHDDDVTRIDPMTRTARVPAYTGPVAGESQRADDLRALDANATQIDLGDNDPLAEADFHIAYGLYEEAALLLQQASSREPERADLQIKLAETYFAAGLPEKFLQTAQKLKPQIGDEAWSKVAIMGRQICPGEALFSGASDGGGGELDLDLAFDAPSDVPVTTIDEGLEFRLEELELPGQDGGQIGEQTAHQDNTLEFDLGEFDLGGSEAKAPKIDAPTRVSLDDFDLAGPGASGASGASGSDFDLSLDDVDPQVIDDVLNDETLEGSDDSGTKLDLARAYVEMGDSEMARGLLDEVEQSGSDDQRREAQALRARLLG